jgi:hypothetical protein
MVKTDLGKNHQRMLKMGKLDEGWDIFVVSMIPYRLLIASGGK